MQKSWGRLLGKLAVYLLAIVLLSVTGAWARPTTAEEAGNVVTNWLGLDAQPMDAAMSRQVKEVRSFAGPDGATAYYVVFLQPRGLVIVPADDLVEPIIGFLPAKMTYSPSLRNPLGALVSKDVPGRVLHARGVEAASLESGQPLPSENPMAQAQRKWAWLADPTFSPEALEFGLTTVSNIRVAPFVKSRWDQSTVGGQACYNYYVPPYADGTAANYPSGCVATAMSQLMRYFQWPKVGVGTGSYNIYIDDPYLTTPIPENLRGGDGAGGPYAWANMPLVPTSPTLAQRQAIGALLHDAGTAVNMEYEGAGSGTDTLKAATAFTGPFKYSNARRGYYAGSNLPAANRDRMVNPNLHAKYPILFGITGPLGGHAIVCDGYCYQVGTMYHHLNMGWSGGSDAWYNLPNIDVGFTSVYKCVYNVYKAGSGEIIAGRVVDAAGKAISGALVKATRTGGTAFIRSGTTDSKGIYALVKVPSAASFSVRVTKTGYTFPNKSTSTGTSLNNSTTCGNVWNLNFKGTPL